MTSPAAVVGTRSTSGRGLRALAILVSLAGIAAAVVLLWLTWSTPGTELASRLSDTLRAGSSLLLPGLALLIVLRAGNEPSNLSMALAIGFAFSVDTFSRVLFPLCGDSRVAVIAVKLALFVFAAGFVIRASQLFPRRLVPNDIASSPTIWGRVRISRWVLTQLLRPWLTWLTVVVVAALAVLLFQLIALGIRATLGPSLPAETRQLLSLGLNVVLTLTLVTCFYAAVFHAGAISPELVLRKTVVYGATIAVLLFAFATVQAMISDALVDLLGIEDRAGSAMVGTMFGLAFQPLARWIQGALQRFPLPGRGRADVAAPGSSRPR